MHKPVNWVEHVKSQVQLIETLREEHEDAFPECLMPTINLNHENKVETYKPAESETVITEKPTNVHWHDWWYAKRNKPYTTNVGKRHARGKANGTGQVLLKSFVKSGVHIEKIFTTYK